MINLQKIKPTTPKDPKRLDQPNEYYKNRQFLRKWDMAQLSENSKRIRDQRTLPGSRPVHGEF